MTLGENILFEVNIHSYNMQYKQCVSMCLSFPFSRFCIKHLLHTGFPFITQRLRSGQFFPATWLQRSVGPFSWLFFPLCVCTLVYLYNSGLCCRYVLSNRDPLANRGHFGYSLLVMLKIMLISCQKPSGRFLLILAKRGLDCVWVFMSTFVARSVCS